MHLQYLLDVVHPRLRIAIERTMAIVFGPQNAEDKPTWNILDADVDMEAGEIPTSWLLLVPRADRLTIPRELFAITHPLVQDAVVWYTQSTPEVFARNPLVDTVRIGRVLQDRQLRRCQGRSEIEGFLLSCGFAIGTPRLAYRHAILRKLTVFKKEKEGKDSHILYFKRKITQYIGFLQAVFPYHYKIG